MWLAQELAAYWLDQLFSLSSWFYFTVGVVVINCLFEPKDDAPVAVRKEPFEENHGSVF